MFLVTKKPHPLRGKVSFWGLAPALSVSFAVVFVGGFFVLYQSFGGFLPDDIKNEAGNIWVNLFNDKTFINTIGFSLKVATLSTLFSAFLGLLLALLLWSQFQKYLITSLLYVIPLIAPHILAGFFIQAFFSQSGILSSFLFKIGLIDNLQDFPVLVFDQKGIGVILSYVYKESAFITLLIIASLRKLSPDLITTSNMLGGSTWRKFRTIIYPHISSTLYIGMLIAFIYSLGSFDIPFIVGSSSMPMISIKAYSLFFEGSLAQRPYAAAHLSVIWIISLCILIIFILVRKKENNRETRNIT